MIYYHQPGPPGGIVVPPLGAIARQSRARLIAGFYAGDGLHGIGLWSYLPAACERPIKIPAFQVGYAEKVGRVALPIHARTLDFVSRRAKADPTIVDNREAVHKMVQNAITRNLAAQGVK